VEVKSSVELAPTHPHRTKPELAVELITLLASWLPDREFLLTGDSAYGGASVAKHLPANINLISRAHAKAVLYTVAPPRVPGKKGPPRKRGDRLPTITDWANDATKPWESMSFNQYGFACSYPREDLPGFVLHHDRPKVGDHCPESRYGRRTSRSSFLLH
jgi:hypothetical protein